MAADKNPSKGGFLAVLEAKYAALGKLIESYRAADSLGALGQPGDVDLSVFDVPMGSTSTGGASFDLPTGALLGKSIPGAVKLYLGAVKKKQTTREVTTALKDGGVESTAASFENTVTSALHRLKAAGEVLQFKDGWALAEFYPANLRNRIADDGKITARRKTAKASTKKRAAASSKKPKATNTKSQTTGKGKPAAESIDSRIAAYLKAHSEQGFMPSQIGEALKETDPKAVGMAFARLTRFGKVEKDAAGLYRAA